MGHTKSFVILEDGTVIWDIFGADNDDDSDDEDEDDDDTGGDDDDDEDDDSDGDDEDDSDEDEDEEETVESLKKKLADVEEERDRAIRRMKAADKTAIAANKKADQPSLHASNAQHQRRDFRVVGVPKHEQNQRHTKHDHDLAARLIASGWRCLLLGHVNPPSKQQNGAHRAPQGKNPRFQPFFGLRALFAIAFNLALGVNFTTWVAGTFIGTPS